VLGMGIDKVINRGSRICRTGTLGVQVMADHEVTWVGLMDTGRSMTWALGRTSRDVGRDKGLSV
jgi:hypothetical protein